jgi:hypothetical protein
LSIESIINEAFSVASEFGLACEVIDVTNNTANARLYLDKNLFIQVYANQIKDKLNLHLIFKGKRLYGADAEGGNYHLHPFEEPDSHIFTQEKEDLRSFTLKSLEFLTREGIL